MNDPNPQEPKIVVDDDWKSQVQQEKEKAKEESAPTPDEQANDGIPPASFPLLVSTLASQALSGLGAIPDPIENRPIVRLDLAKHMIDTLSMLEEKTQGNLSEEESQMLTSTVHQLRMAFLQTQQQATSAPAGEPPKSQIELP